MSQLKPDSTHNCKPNIKTSILKRITVKIITELKKLNLILWILDSLRLYKYIKKSNQQIKKNQKSKLNKSQKIKQSKNKKIKISKNKKMKE